MKKRIFSILLLTVLLAVLLCGCGKETDITTAKVTPDEAKQIVLDEMGITEEEALSLMIHYGDYDGDFCYSIMFSTWERDYEFVVSGTTGEILARSDAQEATTGGETVD